MLNPSSKFPCLQARQLSVHLPQPFLSGPSLSPQASPAGDAAVRKSGRQGQAGTPMCLRIVHVHVCLDVEGKKISVTLSS